MQQRLFTIARIKKLKQRRKENQEPNQNWFTLIAHSCGGVGGGSKNKTKQTKKHMGKKYVRVAVALMSHCLVNWFKVDQMSKQCNLMVDNKMSLSFVLLLSIFNHTIFCIHQIEPLLM